MINKLLHAWTNRKVISSDPMFAGDPTFVPIVLSPEAQKLRSILQLDYVGSDYYLKYYLAAIEAFPALKELTNDRVTTYSVKDFLPFTPTLEGADFVSNTGVCGIFTDLKPTSVPVTLTYTLDYVNDRLCRIVGVETGVTVVAACNAASDVNDVFLNVAWPPGIPFSGPLKLTQAWVSGARVVIRVEPSRFPVSNLISQLQTNFYFIQLLGNFQAMGDFKNALDLRERLAIALVVLALSHPVTYIADIVRPRPPRIILPQPLRRGFGVIVPVPPTTPTPTPTPVPTPTPTPVPTPTPTPVPTPTPTPVPTPTPTPVPTPTPTPVPTPTPTPVPTPTPTCVPADYDIITPDVTTGAVSEFTSLSVYPAGNYRVTYVSGAIKYNPAFDYCVQWPVGGDMFRIVHDNGATQIEAPGDNVFYATVGAAETANAGAFVDFVHTGGTIGIFLLDSPYEDNIGSVSFQLHKICSDVPPPATPPPTCPFNSFVWTLNGYQSETDPIYQSFGNGGRFLIRCSVSTGTDTAQYVTPSDLPSFNGKLILDVTITDPDLAGTALQVLLLGPTDSDFMAHLVNDGDITTSGHYEIPFTTSGILTGQLLELAIQTGARAETVTLEVIGSIICV